MSKPNDNVRRSSTQLQLKSRCCLPNPTPLLATKHLKAVACVQSAAWEMITLALSVTLALQQISANLEARLNYYLDVLAASTGCDDAEAERLLARWDALNAEYAATITALAAVSQSVNSENPALKDQ